MSAFSAYQQQWAATSPEQKSRCASESPQSVERLNHSTGSAQSAEKRGKEGRQTPLPPQPCFAFELNESRERLSSNDERGICESGRGGNHIGYTNVNSNNNNLRRGNRTSSGRCSRSDKQSCTNLFIGNVPHSMEQCELEKVFAPYGEIVSAAVMRNIHTGTSLGNAFVRYATTEEAEKAIAGMAGKRLNGRTITVQWAKKQHDDTPVGEARKKIFKLFVRNIPLEITEADLKQHFGLYGPVKTVSIHKDTAPDTDKNSERHIAFITYLVEGAAERAAEAVHNTRPFASCGKVPLMVKLAEEFPQHSHHGNGSHGLGNNAKGSKTMQRGVGKPFPAREGASDGSTSRGGPLFGGRTADTIVGAPPSFFSPMATAAAAWGGGGGFYLSSAIPAAGVRNEHVCSLGTPLIVPARAGVPLIIPDGDITTAGGVEPRALKSALIAPYFPSSVPVVGSKAFAPVPVYSAPLLPLATPFGGLPVDIAGFAPSVPLAAYGPALGAAK